MLSQRSMAKREAEGLDLTMSMISRLVARQDFRGGKDLMRFHFVGKRFSVK